MTSLGQCSGGLAASELVLAEGDQLGDVAGLAGAGDRPAAQEVVLTADGPADGGQQVTAATHDTPTCREGVTWGDVRDGMVCVMARGKTVVTSLGVSRYGHSTTHRPRAYTTTFLILLL